jgi:hypothetical protein
MLLIREFQVGLQQEKQSGPEKGKLRGPRLLAYRNFHQFWHLSPQGLEIGRFGFRIINRLFGKPCIAIPAVVAVYCESASQSIFWPSPRAS